MENSGQLGLKQQQSFITIMQKSTTKNSLRNRNQVHQSHQHSTFIKNPSIVFLKTPYPSWIEDKCIHTSNFKSKNLPAYSTILCVLKLIMTRGKRSLHFMSWFGKKKESKTNQYEEQKRMQQLSGLYELEQVCIMLLYDGCLKALSSTMSISAWNHICHWRVLEENRTTNEVIKLQKITNKLQSRDKLNYTHKSNIDKTTK